MPNVSGLLGSLLLFTVLSLTYYYIIVCALHGSYGTSLFPVPPPPRVTTSFVTLHGYVTFFLIIWERGMLS